MSHQNGSIISFEGSENRDENSHVHTDIIDEESSSDSSWSNPEEESNESIESRSSRGSTIIEDDGEMEELREFVREEPPIIRSISQMYERIEKHIYYIEIFLILVLIFGIFVFVASYIGETPSAFDETCWEKFKAAKCNLDNLTSGICQNLHKCIEKKETLEDQGNIGIIYTSGIMGLILLAYKFRNSWIARIGERIWRIMR